MPPTPSAASAPHVPEAGTVPPPRPFAFFLRMAREDAHALWPMFAGAAIGALVTLAQMAVLAWLLVALLRDGRPLEELHVPLAGLALLFVLRALVAGHAAAHGARVAARARTLLRGHLLGRWTAESANPLRGAPPAIRASQTVEGVERCGPWFSHFLPAAVQMAVIPPLLVVFVLWLDWRSGLILALTGPLIPALMAGIGILTKKRSGDQLEALHRMSAHFHDVLRAFETLVIFGDERRTRDRVAAVANEFRHRTMRVLRLAFLSGFVLELAASLSIALVAISVGFRLLEGSIALLPALLILLLAPEFYLPFRRVGARHHMAMEAAAAARPLIEELGATAPGDPREIAAAGAGSTIEGSASVAARADSPRTSGPLQLPASGIRFHGLRFRQEDAACDALGPVDLALPARGLFAVVGPSGAGKSTLFAGLMGFVPQSGGAIEPPLHRAHFAWVPQHPFFPDAPLLELLRLADPGLEAAAAEALLERAAAADLIPRLRQGAPLGEGARRLSGGQRQRLAIARALASEAPILLLDEPTASLDDEAERAVLCTLAALACERLVLTITHRAPVAAASDGVLLVQGGAVRGPRTTVPGGAHA